MQSQNIESPAAMSDRDRAMTEVQEELERLRRRIAELESRGARDRSDETLEIRDQAIRSSINGIALSDLSGMLTFVNPSFLAMWGYEDAGEVLGRSAASFWESGEQAERVIQELGERGGWVGEMAAMRKNGERFPVQLSATMIRGRTGTPLGMMASFLDITERKRAEEKVHHITRLYALLSQINHAIVRTTDRDELFPSLCRVAVEFGRFKLAWIGLADEATGNVKPVAHAGQDEGYLDALSISTGDRPEGKGPTGSALRQGTLILCDDIATDPRMLPWRDEALRRGYRSSAAIPFRLKEKVIGSLNLYATEPGFFTEDERKLLTELGIEISFALDNMEREKMRLRAEEALRESEEQYRSFFENAAVAVAIVDRDGYVVEANDTDCRFLGYPRAELIGMHFTKFTHPQDIDVDVHLFQSLMAGQRHEYEIEKRYVRKDGDVVWGRVAVSLIRDLQGSHRYTSVVCYDITEAKRAEGALRESEQKYRTLFDSATDAIFILDLDGNLIDVNRNGYTRLGYTKQEMLSLHISQLDQAEFAASVPERIAQVSRQGEAVFESAHRRKDGSVMPVEVNSRLIDYEGRKAYFSIIRDITERKRMEEALRESEERLQFMMSNSPAVIYTCRPSGDFGATFVTANVAHQLGYEASAFLTDSGFWAAHIHPDDAPQVFAGLSGLFAEGSHAHEYRFRHKDGIWRWMHDELKLIRNAAGEPVEILGSWIDITGRKRAEEALRESEERLRLALSAAKQGLYDLNVQTGETVVTPEYARMLGYAPEEFTETNARWIERLHPDDRAPVADTYRAYVSGVVPEYRVEFRQRTASGEWKWILSIGRIVEYDASGNPLRMLGTHTDITDQKRAEQERLELERRLLHTQKLESLGILAGGIAHDFNNLLMAVLGNLDLALRKVSPVSPARANIEQSAQAARRATDLTRQMLAYSGKGRFIVKAMDLSELVEENAHLFRSSVARTATLDVLLGRSLPRIEADAGQVQQVIMNLITNASEAIGDKAGRIAITTGVQECDEQCLKRSRIEDVPPAGRFVCLEVSDTGCGMDEQTQERLFDPFFTTKATGRGLGMSAILGIVRGHGGAIFVESNRGRGTAIRILFPALEEARAKKEAVNDARAAEAGAPAVSGTVLVVDDEEIVRMVCKEMVESMGLQVLTAVDGRDAVDLFTRHAGSISHVILDLSMPNMDGMAAFAELVRIKPGVKVILSSGYDEQDSLKRLSGPGPAGFIQKPYSLKNLRDALEKAGAAGA